MPIHKMAHEIKLKIAEVVIGFKSYIPVRPLTTGGDFRLAPFIYRGNRKPDIELEVIISNSNPAKLKREKRLFFTLHPEDQERSWSIYKAGRDFIIRSYLKGKRQDAILNRSFSKGIVYIFTRKTRVKSWPLEIIIYDILQIILINYLVKHKGFFLHSMAVKDTDNSGLIFIGKSGSGKTTMARIWDKYSKAKVLNDDRVIVRNFNGRFYIYGTPWHGDFADYLRSLPYRARLDKLFFIVQNKTNLLENLSEKETNAFLYQNIFFTFWDKTGLRQALDLGKELSRSVPAYRLGFKDEKCIIGFVRNDASYNSKISFFKLRA